MSVDDNQDNDGAKPPEARKFLFQRDFAAPAGEQTPKSREALAEAERRGREAGFKEGQAQARAEADAQMQQVLGRIADDVAALLARADEDRATFEDEAIAFATALAEKLAADALAHYPMDAIAQLARKSFEHLRGVPHLVVRVNEGLVEKTEKMMQKLARERGFEGRLVIMGEPEIAPGDARLEWADGGVVREGAKIGASVADAIRAA
ncbi:MAG: flagellar assembly protein FliH [Salinarimonas sp.]|nr:flagellar assembly protein FliH [Salinarimonas sp.]